MRPAPAVRGHAAGALPQTDGRQRATIMRDLEKFIAGFSRFQENYCREDGLFQQLRESQHPSTLLIGCCDSRVDPALLTGSDPGELFVVRNIANIVPTCTPEAPPGVSSAIEFAVCSLQVERVIVLGHSRCGGIRALMDDVVVDAETDFVSRWMRFAARAKAQVRRELAHKTPQQQRRACEMANILCSLDNLLSYPWLRRRVEAQQLSLHGWYFDLEEGALLAYSPRQQAFLPLVCPLDRTVHIGHRG